jgi:predicted RNA-binding Zn-ribbon protein involved in translation (DUF1610 family)
MVPFLSTLFLLNAATDMNLTESFQKAKQLIEELDIDLSKKTELIHVIKTIEQLAKNGQHSQQLLSFDTQSGCYVIEGDASRYCPQCYEKDQHRSATQRINSKLRVCPRCRKSIKPN